MLPKVQRLSTNKCSPTSRKLSNRTLLQRTKQNRIKFRQKTMFGTQYQQKIDQLVVKDKKL